MALDPNESLGNQHKKSICTDVGLIKDRLIKKLDKYIGDLYIDNIHMGTLRPFIEARKKRLYKNTND